MTAPDPHRRPAPPPAAAASPPPAHYPPLIPYYPHHPQQPLPQFHPPHPHPNHHHPPYPPPPPPPLPPNQLPHHAMPMIRPVNVIHVPRPSPAAPLPVSLPRPLKAGAASMSPNSFIGNGGVRDFRGKDDTSAVVRERKVMASNKDSLYALCRSWLRSGYIHELQSPYGDGVKSLPKPLPLSALESSAVSREGDGDACDDDKQEEQNMEDLSASDLLKRHVKHAKRVRTRLREERLQRMERYKARLALLIPSSQEEQYKGDPIA